MGFRDDGFDNRSLGPLVRQHLLHRPAGHHFQARVGDMRLSYCLIRKNACSAFKAYLLSKCPEDIREMGKRGTLKALREHERRTPSWPPAESDISIFVYRDPFDRVVSLFNNKFVEARGAQAIQRSFVKMTGERVEDTSFARFVTGYVAQYRRGIDAHLRLQRGHLLPMRYTHAVPIRRLLPTMAGIIGEAEAQAYFGRPENAASSPKAALPGASTMPVAALRKVHAESGVLPDAASLLTDELRAVIARIYRRDMVFADPPPRRA